MYSNPSARKSVDTIQQKRRSTTDSIQFIRESSNTTSGRGPSTMLESGQNAISTLLQPPIVRTGFQPHTSAPASSTHSPPTARDIPPVTLTNTPHVDAAEFKPYITKVGALYERLRRAKESEDEAADVLHRKSSGKDESAAVLDDGHPGPRKTPPVSRKGSISSISAVEAPSSARRSSSGSVRGAAQVSSPLSIIPAVYFKEDFRLENPRTFDVVSEKSEVVRPLQGTVDEKTAMKGDVAPRKVLATNAILQEKLSWYMDTIELHLITSILTASTTFFGALNSLRELYSEVADSVESIKALRKELEALDDEIATNGLNIIQKQQRRNNLQRLLSAVLQVHHVVDGVATCESLVDNGEVEKALENIDILEDLLAVGSDSSKTTSKLIVWMGLQPRDLRGVIALQSVHDDLTTLRLRIGKAYETRFLDLLMGDLQHHSEAVTAQEVLIRWANASMRSRGTQIRDPSVFPSHLSSIGALRSALFESLAGLHRARYLTTAVVAYREAVLKEIRNLVRRSLPSSDDDNDSVMSSSTTSSRSNLSKHEKSSILARNLRSLGPEDSEELLVNIYIRTTETLRRLTTQVKLLLDVAGSLGDDSIPAQELHEAMGLPNLLGEAVDVAQDKVVKLLRVRSEQSTHLPLIRFVRYFTLNLYFANECESISGRSGAALKRVVNGQITEFIRRLTEAAKQKLVQGMDSDRWVAADFSEKDTAKLNRILSCSTEDPAEWLHASKLWVPCVDDDPDSDRADNPQPNSDGQAKTTNASIDEEIFVLPKSAILCMDGLALFLRLIVGIPSMTSDIGTSLASYLQLFNSRCTQLVLGAGARRSAGLKNITSKHLVLASRALAFIAALISHVREFVRRHATSHAAAASSVVEFDKVKRLYQEHQNGIYDKLVEIMDRLAASHVKAMSNIDWDNGEKIVHPYMVALVKDTTSLHRILAKNLPEGIVRTLMASISTSYKDQFGKVLQEIDIKTEFGRDSMLHDVELFQSKLGMTDLCGDAGEYLITIIMSKQVESAAGKVGQKVTEDTADSVEARDESEEQTKGDSEGT
ncbi:Vps54-like protein-domain-containing protein [Xylariaceae sp. FL0804]|nr:Vps54-like protein-domain-containing protein [Xylariaceae sp. FL0804]